MHHLSRSRPMSRRSVLRAGGAALAFAAATGLQDTAAWAQASDTAEPFSFDILIERARSLAGEEYTAPTQLGEPFTTLDYDLSLIHI